MAREIRALTGLRGGAAGYVCAYHLLFGRGTTGAVVQRALSKGYLSVDIFFVLSGLVMALTYKPAFERGYGLAVHGEFLIRRAGRIVPLYGFVLLATVAVYAPAGRLFAPGVVTANLLLIQGWGLHVPSIIPPGWSISTEAAAYILFPAMLVMAIFSSRAGGWASLALAIILVLVSSTLVTPSASIYMHGALDVWDDATAGPLLRCLGGFLLGLLTFRAARSQSVCAVAGSDMFGVVVLGLLAGGVMSGVPDLVIYPLFPALVLCLYVNRGRVAAVAGSAPLHWLGVISYGIYLIHSVVIEFLWPASQAWLVGHSTTLRGAASVILCTCATLIAAQLLHVTIELPGRTLARRISLPSLRDAPQNHRSGRGS